jgi:chemotaxis protein CheD
MPKHKEKRNLIEPSSAIVVKPGELRIVHEASSLMAVVACGVVVCLWAQSNDGIGGMCHFVEPGVYDPAKATCRFGNVAVPTMIGMIRKLETGGVLEAQIFGGAVRKSNDEIGTKNVEMARKILQAREIQIVSQDVGGSKGRKILFDSATGHTAVLKVHTVREDDWIG